LSIQLDQVVLNPIAEYEDHRMNFTDEFSTQEGGV
jgi:hypothetical protein